MRRSILFLFTGIFIFGNSQIFAQDEPKFGCPIASELKEPWFNLVAKESNELYSVYKRGVQDRFGQKWTFRISKIVASSYDDAVEKGKKALDSLKGWPSPILINGVYRCYYEIDHDYRAEAWESK